MSIRTLCLIVALGFVGCVDGQQDDEGAGVAAAVTQVGAHSATASPEPPDPSVSTQAPTDASAATAPRALESSLATVVSITDGDTILVLVDGSEESVRLIGINTPEINECFGPEAATRLSQLVAGAAVRLERDVSDRDQFGRLLRYVYIGDLFVNDMLVREGFANAYRHEPDIGLADLLDASQVEAQAANLGLWASDACGAIAAGDIAVGAVHEDAAGNDHENLNDEWIVLRNVGAFSVDLTGWGVKDETASHRYGFPNGLTLAAGATVRLHTGCGADSAAALFWCSATGAIWNNGSDTVFVLDPSGNIVAARPY